MESNEESANYKLFAPYEHVIYKRIYLGESNNCMARSNINSGDMGQIEIPVGYEYLSSHYFNTYYDKSPNSLYVDVWYINYTEVKAKATYSRRYNSYVYQTPGIPISNVLEKPKGPSYRSKQ